MMSSSLPSIGIIGGTGKEGKGLAYRWAKYGYTVWIGSRQKEKADNAAKEVNSLLGREDVVIGGPNEEVAHNSQIVVLTVPFAAHVDMCKFLYPYVQGKIVVDVTVPIVPPKVSVVQMPVEGSATQQAQAIFGENVQVVAAFQNISYEHLLNDEEVECDVLVCGGSKDAREEVIGMVEAAGLVGWNAGPAENAVVVEGLTSVLIGLNKRYGVHSSGIRITGIPR
jgi:8-hydroxy-5-deazaflavin:NADPH oxidoreductase